jgi:hypothetical protein
VGRPLARCEEYSLEVATRPTAYTVEEEEEEEEEEEAESVKRSFL